jgi:GNAT superfamily N-acetyltransferase
MLHEKYPTEVILKDGKEVILRPLAEEDEEALRQFYGELCLSDRWFFKEDPCNRAVIKGWLENQKTGQAFCLLALHEGRIVAHASILMRPYGCRSHIGRLRITVSPQFRSQRLGTWMVLDLIRRAMDLGLDKVQADFVVGVDDLAIEAVRRLDFVEEGLLKDYVRDEKGISYDCRIMVRHLHKGWSDF